MKYKGKFIVIEGPDGAGTTLHSGRLSQKLDKSGVKCLLTAEPTDGPIGLHIRTELFKKKRVSPDALQLMFCADRAEHVQSVILPALRKGQTVICDRYIPSTLIYGQALGLNLDWLTKINTVFPKPDLTLIMLPSLDIALKRVLKRDVLDAFENAAFQKKIYGLYKKYASAKKIKVVDTGGEKEETALKIFRLVEKIL